jgi:hypothetical protein
VHLLPILKQGLVIEYLHQLLGDNSKLRDLMKASNQSDEFIANLYAIVSLTFPDFHA